MINPKDLKKWLLVVAIVYLLFPRDLIPDYLGRGLGFVDDLSLMALLTYFYRRYLQQVAARSSQESGGRGESGGRDQREGSTPPRAEPLRGSRNPYEVLGVSSSASKQEIDSAYKARMTEYHPDKVTHLGEELQKLAHRKALEIQQAYQQLRK